MGGRLREGENVGPNRGNTFKKFNGKGRQQLSTREGDS